MKTIAIVTGASSGMGRDFVLELLNDHAIQEIWMIARRKNRLEALERKHPKRLRSIPLDLTDMDSYDILKDLLKKEPISISYVVNAAGMGKMGNVEEISVKDHALLLDLNVKALTCITKLSLPYMKRGGHIIQLSSGAAFFPQPEFASYAASKAYVLSFSRALGQELKKRKIFVTSVCPGPVHTEFFQAAGSVVHPKKKHFMAQSKNVVKQAMHDARARKELSIYGTGMKILHLAGKFIPTKIIFLLMNYFMK